MGPSSVFRGHCGQCQMRLDRLWWDAQALEVSQASVLSISFAALRLQSQGAGKGAAQGIEILSRKVHGE